jgi:phospholipase/lecithinase/hemolysin
MVRQMDNVTARMLRAAVLVTLSALPLQAPAFPYSALIVFGDSLADAGNNAAVLDATMPPPGTARTPTPILSNDFIPTFP